MSPLDRTHPSDPPQSLPVRRRSTRPVVALLALTALFAGAAPAVASTRAPAATPAPAPSAPTVSPRVLASFPDDRLTVPDATQLTGRRVSLPQVDCARQATSCDLARLLNQLDGFDLDPRISVTFSRPVDAAAVAAATTVEKVRGPGPALRTGVDRVVYDPAHASVFMHPQVQLAPSTTYRLRVRGPGLPLLDRTFTTLSATTDLRRMIGQLDSGQAYDAAGIGEQARGLVVDRVVPAAGTVLAYTADRGPATATVTATVPSLAGTGAGSYVFGSFLSPSWLTRERVIPQTPTRGTGPSVRGRERLPFVMVLPAGQAPEGGWPVAVFGHGFTGSTANLFSAAASNSARGLATVATDVVGHGFGPASTWRITREGVTTTVPAYGRGVDLNEDGVIESTEGSSTPGNPGQFGSVNNRDGLRQTVADVAALVRATARGLPDGPALAGARPTYYGQSFGGIYGTMLGAVDPQVSRLLLNVPGGPITEIARLSPAFRPLTVAALAGARPSLLNGGPLGFTESMPLPGDAPELSPAPGALAVQDYLAQTTWLGRSGSPEAYAPLLRATPAGGSPSAVKDVVIQVAYGDQTVPNPTSRTLIAAGGLFDRTSLYRNDRTAQATRNPHGFLLDPSFEQGFLPGQRLLVDFLLTGTVTDPDGAGPVWEVPIADPDVLRTLNFPNALHP